MYLFLLGMVFVNLFERAEEFLWAFVPIGSGILQKSAEFNRNKNIIKTLDILLRILNY